MTTAGASGGPLTNCFYDTTYRAAYDTHRGSMTPDLRPSCQTGFTLNQRPPLRHQYGAPRCFMSQTRKDFQPHSRALTWKSPNIIPEPARSSRRPVAEAEAEQMQTEHRRAFAPRPLTSPAVESQDHMTGRPRDRTGFTAGTERRLITFQEKKEHMGEPRQRHISVTKMDFRPPFPLQSFQGLPSVHSLNSSSGYTRGSVAPLGWDSFQLRDSQSEPTASSQRIMEKKGPSGFLLEMPSNQILPDVPFEPSHFQSLYYDSLRAHSGAPVIGYERQRSHMGRREDAPLWRLRPSRTIVCRDKKSVSAEALINKTKDLE